MFQLRNSDLTCKFILYLCITLVIFSLSVFSYDLTIVFQQEIEEPYHIPLSDYLSDQGIADRNKAASNDLDIIEHKITSDEIEKLKQEIGNPIISG